MSVNLRGPVRIAEAVLDVERYELLRDGQRVPLERLPMELLILMASRSGQLVTRADIGKTLWGGSPFRDTDTSINTAIRKIRVAVGEDPEHPRHLLTVKGKGYRLETEPVAAAEPPHDMPAEAAPPPVRVLVLPFRDHADSGDLQGLCDALADETSANLGAMHPGTVSMIARTTAARYRATSRSIAEIAQELGLDYVLEGAVSHADGRVRVLAQLVRCVDQAQIWAGSREAAGHDLLAVQRDMGLSLAADLSPALAEQQGRRLARRLPIDPSAHDAFLRGRYYWTRRVHFDAGFAGLHGLSVEDFIRARGYFETALERDPTYALGYVGLSNVYGSTAAHGFYPSSEGYPKARETALRALELDPGLPEAHQALAGVHYFYDWDWRKAEAELIEALRLNPDHAETSRLYARLLLVLGREAEGRAQFERAERADPLGFEGSRIFGLVQAGHYDDVVRTHLAGGNGNRSPLVYQLLAIALEVQGHYDGAIEATAEALTRCDEFRRAESVRTVFREHGHDAVLQWYLRDLMARSRRGYTSPLLFAELHARLKNADEMFHWLDIALAERSPRLCELRTNPWFQRYRSMHRFREVEKRVGF